MYTEELEALGLFRNEAIVYETLLREGQLSVGKIAVKAKIHRRNVYDTMQRLVERGLVFEILESRETLYQAVEPGKLSELIEEKETLLKKILPDLGRIYSKTPDKEAVMVYRGVEGWKNYLRDILRVGEDVYCLGAKGAWMDPRVMNLFPSFIKEAKRKKIGYFHLFDYEVKEKKHEIIKYVGKNYRFLPKGYSAPAAVDVFGSHVNILSNIHLGGMGEDFWFTVIINQQIADAFRLWFRFMYDQCS